MNVKIQRFGLICFVFIALLVSFAAGCKKTQEITTLPTVTPEITIPFETIENAENSWRHGNYEGEAPKLVIVTTLNEAKELGETISIDAEAQLQKVDFSQVFAVVVFQGGKGSGSYKVNILKIVQEDDQLIIFSHFTEPLPEHVVTMGATSPYHLIEIQKNGFQGDISFALNVDGQIIIQQPKFIP